MPEGFHFCGVYFDLMRIGDTVQGLQGRSIFDSRGNPTTEADLLCNGKVFRASCPSGASTGSQEALELRDGDPGICSGKGVSKALGGIRQIAESLGKIADRDVTDQREIDAFLCALDGTPNKRSLGANAILPVSIAFCRAGASALGMEPWEFVGKLHAPSASSRGEPRSPKLFFNVINGGSHSSSGLFVQEIMVSFPDRRPRDVLNKSSAFYAGLKELVGEKYLSTGIGDEGGFAPDVKSLEEALDLILEAGLRTGLEPEIALDVAATEFFTERGYDVGWKQGEPSLKSAEELIGYYEKVMRKYPQITMLEDPFAEKDYAAWKSFLPAAQRKGVKVVGDDLLVTDRRLVEEAGTNRWCDVALIKMNQVGTISETIDAVQEARRQGMLVMASHRSGETEDAFLSHLAVGIGADFMKAGALCRSERVAKYNEILRIVGEQ